MSVNTGTVILLPPEMVISLPSIESVCASAPPLRLDKSTELPLDINNLPSITDKFW